jgi:hypothetical protein
MRCSSTHRGEMAITRDHDEPVGGRAGQRQRQPSISVVDRLQNRNDTQWVIAIAGVLPESLIDELPEPRRTLHRRALGVLERHERDGVPFALVLRSYGITQFFGGRGIGPGQLFENILLAALDPAGIGVIQVQMPERAPIYDDNHDQRIFMAVRAPSLFADYNRWRQAVVSMIARAELIVVVIPQMTPGVEFELNAIADARRTERTVVLVTGEDLGGPEDGTMAMVDGHELPDTSQTMRAPVLRKFPRVLWVGDLDPRAPLDGFAFRGPVLRHRRPPGAPLRARARGGRS